MPLYSRRLNELKVGHGFFAPGENLNLAENRNPLNPQLPKQVHGVRVVHGSRLGVSPADGLWQNACERAVGIQTADCIPVLLAAPKFARIAAIHAGWRGVAGRIVERFLRRQSQLGIPMSSWLAALGPAAGGCCYEIGPEVGEALGILAIRQRIDLRSILAERLRHLGIGDVDMVGPCTICSQAGWASYRRQSQSAGRNIAVVVLPSGFGASAT